MGHTAPMRKKNVRPGRTHNQIPDRLGDQDNIPLRRKIDMVRFFGKQEKKKLTNRFGPLKIVNRGQ